MRSPQLRKILTKRFRSHLYQFELDHKIANLKMRPGRFQDYVEQFLALSAQSIVASPDVRTKRGNSFKDACLV